ncbi:MULTISPECIES: hypothetical protein [Methanobacterium]|uniref:hypothetical protein n=1 Tax=Methanobacterium TaxID=2160 RepID=UPI00114CA6B8|nr:MULTISPECIES: hypothetical protein [Methanobacterium]
MKITKNAQLKQYAMIKNNFLSLSLNAEYAAINNEAPAKLKTINFGIKAVMSIFTPFNLLFFYLLTIKYWNVKNYILFIVTLLV